MQERSTVSSQFLRRTFMRVVIRRISTPDLLSALYQQHATRAASAAIAEAEAVLPRCLHELHRLSAQSVTGPADWVHIFVSLLPPLPLCGEAGSAMHIAAALRAAAAQAAARHAAALRKAAVAEWTIRVRSEVAPDAHASVRGWRIVVSLPSGAYPLSCLRRECYCKVKQIWSLHGVRFVDHLAGVAAGMLKHHLPGNVRQICTILRCHAVYLFQHPDNTIALRESEAPKFHMTVSRG